MMATGSGWMRYDEGQSARQSIYGGVFDAVGVSAFYAGRYNEDIITGQSLGMSAGERGLSIAGGFLQMLPLLGSAANSLRGGSMALRMTASGAAAMESGMAFAGISAGQAAGIMGGYAAGNLFSNVMHMARNGYRVGENSQLTNPHMHHIVFKGRWYHSFRMRNTLDQSKKILNDAGIDFMTANENLVMASNIKGMHTISQAKEVLARLTKAVEKFGNSKQVVTKELQKMKDELELGGILRILHPEAQ